MKKMKGYIFSILAAMGFGSSPLFASIVFNDNISSLMLGFMRVLIMIPIFAIIVIINKEDNFHITLKQFLKIIILAATGGVLTTALLFQSYTCIDTSTATTLNFSYPVFVLIFGIILYKERVTKAVLVSFCLCMAGIVMFCNPSGHFTWMGFLMALGSGISYGIYCLYLDKSNILEEVHFYPFTFYFFLFSAIIFLPIVLLTGNFTTTFSVRGVIFLLLFALDGGIIATVFFQLGVRDIGSQKASILAAMEPVTSIVLGALFLNETITVRSLLGVALVLSATIVLVIFGSKTDSSSSTDVTS